MSRLDSVRCSKEFDVCRLTRVAQVVLAEPQIRPSCPIGYGRIFAGVAWVFWASSNAQKNPFSRDLSLRVFDEAYSPI